MAKITLTDLVNLQNETTAVNAINANNAAIETAMENTLSRDGTMPNQMGNVLDMNNFQLINLPNPVTATSPLRLQDLNTFIGGGSIASIPSGGTTGQVLAKNTNTDFDAGWRNSVTSVALALPADFTVTGSPITTTGTLTGTFVNTPTGTGGFVRATNPVLVTPNLGTPSAGVMTNVTGTAAGLTAGNVTTNANLTGPITSVGNATTIAASPALTGTPTSTTAAVDTNTTQIATTAFVVAQAGSATPIIDGTGTVGTSLRYARQDHIHPTDTSRQAADAQLFSNIPQNSQSTAYTLISTDAEKHILHPTADNNARTFTIPANASVAYAVGTAITFVNQINVVTIAINSDTLTLAGAGTTGSRTLAANGMATALKIGTTSWIISGTGLT